MFAFQLEKTSPKPQVAVLFTTTQITHSCANCSVNLKFQPAKAWFINLASVTSSTPTTQTFSTNNPVLIDSGTAGLILPPADLQVLYTLLGLGPVLNPAAFPIIDCANIANLPTLTFTFSGTVNGGPPLALKLQPTDYISQQVHH